MVGEITVIIITQEDPFYIPLFFEEFFKKLDRSKIDIPAVVINRPLGKRPLSLAKKMLHFYGPLYFLRVGFRYTILKVAGRFKKLTGLLKNRYFSVSDIIEGNGIKAIYEHNINSREFLDYMKTHRPDLIVSVSASQIFKKELLELPRLGCINIHSGKLPRYRGMMPNFWQLYNLEPVSGISVHRMNKNLDDGEIMLQQDVAIDPNESLDVLIRRTKRAGARLMIDALEHFRNETVRYIDNRSEGATYFTFPTREDVKNFKKRGLRLF